MSTIDYALQASPPSRCFLLIVKSHCSEKNKTTPLLSSFVFILPVSPQLTKHLTHQMSGFLRLLRSKWTPPAPITTSFANKTILITGSNTGLGLHAARQFLSLSASRVILAVRSTAKGEAARAQLEAQTGCGKDAIAVVSLDMNSYASITAFVREVEGVHIDVAVLNAGLMNREYISSPEGWEETLQVNTLSTTLLTLLLLPKLRSAAAAAKKVVAEPSSSSLPHLVLVSSGTHTAVQRPWLPSSPSPLLPSLSSAPTPGTSFNGSRQYAISKLLLMYALKSLSALATLPGGEPQVLITSCCPGLCVSDLGRQYKSWYIKYLAWVFYALFARSTEEGSRTLVGAATLGEGAQGGYWKDNRLMR